MKKEEKKTKKMIRKTGGQHSRDDDENFPNPHLVIVTVLFNPLLFCVLYIVQFN